MSLARGLRVGPCCQLTSLRLLASAAVPASAASVERAALTPATLKLVRGQVVELECSSIGWSDAGARVLPERTLELHVCSLQCEQVSACFVCLSWVRSIHVCETKHTQASVVSRCCLSFLGAVGCMLVLAKDSKCVAYCLMLGCAQPNAAVSLLHLQPK